MAELNNLLTRYPDRIAAHILSINPGELSDSQTQADGLQNSSIHSSAVALHRDTERNEAHLFRAENSGFVVFYGPNGHLLFKGGITPPRGHKGDNPGASAIIALLNGRNPPSNQAPVNGCSLVDQSKPCFQTTAFLTK
jgi:hypothetical protein